MEVVLVGGVDMEWHEFLMFYKDKLTRLHPFNK